VLIRHQTQINPLGVHCVLDGHVTPEHSGRRLHEVMRKHRGKTIDVDVQWKGVGDLQRPDTWLRVVLLWNAQCKDSMEMRTCVDKAA
jgi:hypothetical protein